MSVQYGQSPGTKVIVKGGSIQGIEIGEAEITVLFGHGDTASGNATVNDTVQIDSGTTAEEEFGTDSELTEALKAAIGNGADARNGYLYGVAVDTVSVTAEAVAGGSGTLANAPLVEDTATIAVQNTTAIAAETPVFRYDSPPSTGSIAGDEVAIKPQTGEVEAGDTDDYEIDYEYYDWQSAFNAADTLLKEGESGAYFPLSDSESVASAAFSKAENLRDPDYKMVKVIAGAEPNANSSETPVTPIFDAGNYSDALNSLPGFAVAPNRQEDSTHTILGALAGVAAGNALTDPILTDELTGVSLETGNNDEGRLNHGDRQSLRDANVMPIKNEGTIEIDGSLSTDENQLWETDWQTVRVVDRCVLLIHEVAQFIRGQLDTDGVDDIAAQEAQAQLEELADDGLLKNGEDELFVRPASTGQGTVALEVGLTPIQATETFETTITVA